MARPETRLAMAQRHVRDGRRMIERQRRMIALKKEAGLDAHLSERLLHSLEHSQADLEDSLAKAIAERAPAFVN